MRVPKWMLNQRVVVRPYLGSTPYGETYGDPVTVDCHIEHDIKVVKDQSGNEVVSTAHMIAAPGKPVKAEAEVTWEGETYHVISAGSFPGPSGRTHHIEAELG